MPVEEHKELRDLVTQTLQAKGVLQKVQAEIRASVFLALEEQDVFKDKSPFINKALKDYVSTPEGLLAISLIREFLEFFNLEFATMVFDPETHAGMDYTYEGRAKLSKDLMLDANADNRSPLLGLVVKLLTSSLKKSSDAGGSKSSSIKSEISKAAESISDNSEKYSNGFNGTSEHKNMKSDDGQSDHSFHVEKEKTDNKREYEKRMQPKKENINNASLTSLGNLPPLSRASSQNTTSKVGNQQSSIKDIKAILDLEPGSNYEEDLLSHLSDKGKSEGKIDNNGSEESEIEDDISEVASGLTDDNTVDISISKESGKGDYFEDL